MKQLIITHKEIWKRDKYYFTSGGFPFQINEMSKLFSETRLICAHRLKGKQNGLIKIGGKNLTISPIPEPPFKGIKRQLFFCIWLLFHIRIIWNSIKCSDLVHAMIPGDIGLAGIIIAKMMKKPLYIRHCGTWGNKTTAVDRFIYWLLLRIAKGNNIIMATGGGNGLPEKSTPAIRWIFSTSFTKVEWSKMKLAKTWNGNETLKLITVCRLSRGKNVHSIIKSLTKLRKDLKFHLSIVGDGSELENLKKLSKNLGLNDFISFEGNCRHENVMDLLSKNHLFVFPTETKEGFPKALIESMSCGLPVIASRVSVIPYLIENKCGLILDQPNPDSIYHSIIKITSNIHELEMMGKRSREISEFFTLDNWRLKIKGRLEKKWGILN